MWDRYTWIVSAGAIAALVTAYGIGANDLANSFASSVGSRSLKTWQAVVIAAIFEFAGATLLGASVVDTVRSNIARVDRFRHEPELFMYGMLCVVVATGAWLIAATFFEIPVSTTHSAVGGVIGFAIVAEGPGAVVWHQSTSTFPYFKGVTNIVAWWVISPILAGAVGAAVFWLARTFVLRSPYSYRRSLHAFPILVFITVFTNTLLILWKGATSIHAIDTLSPGAAVGVSAATAAVCAGAAALLGYCHLDRALTDGLHKRLAKRVMLGTEGRGEKAYDAGRGYYGARDSADTPVPGTGAGLSQAAAGERRGERERGGASDPLEDLGAEDTRPFLPHAPHPAHTTYTAHSGTRSLHDPAGAAGANDGFSDVELTRLGSDGAGGARANGAAERGVGGAGVGVRGVAVQGWRGVGGRVLRAMWEPFRRGMGQDIHDVVDEDIRIHEMHGAAEQFDEKTEMSFGYIQVLTATCASFAHGANDVANAVAPFASIWFIYKTGRLEKKTEGIQYDMRWILALGGVGIVLGLSTYGYKIMRVLGTKMVKITPSRGFAIELGSAMVVAFGSHAGLPLSSTHCQVGSTVGIGMVDNVKTGVNWRMLPRIFLGWLVTLPVVALSVAALYAQGVYAPSVYGVRDVAAYRAAIDGLSDSVLRAAEANSAALVAAGLGGVVEQARAAAAAAAGARGNAMAGPGFLYESVIAPTQSEFAAVAGAVGSSC